jgi:NAD-dependent dihydropyrimidine dehydrogenase PreA subunit
MIAASDFNTLRYDSTHCIGCGMCEAVCPHHVFRMENRTAVLIHGDDCMECGACQINCPVGAIQVESGVGCAAAMMRAALLRQSTPTCG